MRLPLYLMLAGLLASCVAREPARMTPAEARFNAAWEQAEPWEAAITRFSEAVKGDQDPLLTVLFKGREQEFPPMQVGEIDGIADVEAWREEHVLGPTYRNSASVEPNRDLEAMLKAAFPTLENSHEYWKGTPGARLVDADGDDMAANPPALEDVREVRLVFRLLREPVPLELYGHGTDIDVARWGYGVETVCVELADGDGRALARLFLQHPK